MNYFSKASLKKLTVFLMGNMVCIFAYGQCLTITSSVSEVKCHGTATGGIDITVTGGSGNYNYVWSGTGGAFNGQDRTNISAGNYSLLVTDANNPSCNASKYFVLGEPTPLNIESMDKTWYNGFDLSCSNSQDGQITTVVSGGVGPYEYSFNGSPYQSGNVFSNLSPGTYYSTIKDANGCLVTSDPNSPLPKSVDYVNPPVVITPPPALVVDPIMVLPLPSNATDTVRIFASQSLDLMAGTVNGGVGPYNYLWSPAPAIGDPTSTILTIAPTSTTTYTLTVTDANNCTSARTLVVVVNSVTGGGGGGTGGGGSGGGGGGGTPGVGKTINVCHNGKITKVSINSLAAHVAHGDNIGFCAPWASKPVATDDDHVSNEVIPVNRIFPNPSNGRFAINVATGTGRVEIQVLNGIGTVVEKRNVTVTGEQSLQQFDLTGKPAGVYFIKLISSMQKPQTMRVVIK